MNTEIENNNKKPIKRNMSSVKLLEHEKMNIENDDEFQS